MVFTRAAHRLGDLLGVEARRRETDSMSTIKDVARLAGVGLGTASRAISGRGSVAPATRARVEQAVQALGFQARRGARDRVAASNDAIGIYVPSFTGNFYGPLTQSVHAEVRAVGCQLIAAGGSGAGDERQQALQGIDFLIRRQCAGIVVAAPALADADIVVLQRRFAHIVCINRSATGDTRHCFAIDHELGGRLAARALLHRGHRRIACIAGPADTPDNARRMAGFHAELAEHGVQVPPELRAAGDFSFASGYAATRGLLERAPGAYSALFCANDVMAMAAISRLARANVAVPDDVSVLGFDDSDLATYTSPQLTTVRIPVEHMAANACRYLLNECYGLALAVERDFLPVVMWRQSVLRASGATVSPSGAAQNADARVATSGQAAPA
jgi:LacI family transcriptional regulator